MNFYREYIKKHFVLSVVISAIWIAASVVGIYTAINSAPELTANISEYIDGILNKNAGFVSIVCGGVQTNITYFILLCISASGIILVPAGFFLLAYKGFSAGFTSAFFIKLYALHGVAVSFLCVVLPLFVTLPIWFLAFSHTIDHPMEVHASRKRLTCSECRQFYFSYLLKMLVLLALVCTATIIEAFFTPFIFKILTK